MQPFMTRALRAVLLATVVGPLASEREKHLPRLKHTLGGSARITPCASRCRSVRTAASSSITKSGHAQQGMLASVPSLNIDETGIGVARVAAPRPPAHRTDWWAECQFWEISESVATPHRHQPSPPSRTDSQPASSPEPRAAR